MATATTAPAGRVMTARFSSRCTACGGAIRPGDSIRFRKGAGSRHEACGPNEGGFTPCYAGGRCEDAPCCGCGPA